jgi:8-oxo-dGTP pyrophosphatase MutT (NUDIX family)
MQRHFTVSGFVVHEGRVALHWHRKLAMWLPAGGHIEANEDPVEAVLRETIEEFAIEAEVMQLGLRRGSYYDGGPTQIEPPHCVQNCIVEPGHEHIDFIWHLNGYPGRSEGDNSPPVWFTIEELEAGIGTHNGVHHPLKADVQSLGIEAIRLAETQVPTS